ncbi:class I SAM-dependent methyltransferase [Acidovorax sp. sif1233]|uniref:methyltransferase domain-containing protein n=1 Tax=Acidovorax sp. sif1233 TaxID=2854792 RepID=UPI001C46574B|nr:methyltransferase domain-containing protein [Acidovorax sp. sif1233]MBV7455310.1 class I SAM-dependent methyltransferase [Acidovorax sp. sif1233]
MQIEFDLREKSKIPTTTAKSSLCGSMTEVRKTVADNFISGHGIEIGAFASPLPVPPTAQVTYVDKYNIDDLDANHKVAGLSMSDFGVDLNAVVRPDIVDDGECLSKLGDYSQDFVIANHVLEHFEDPVKGFKNMLRILKHSGILYLSLPEMRHSFDSIRNQTPFEHIHRDYEEGPSWSRELAYAEFAKIFAANGMDKGLFPRRSGDSLAQFESEISRELNTSNYSIHFHAWTMDGMMEMFSKIKNIYNLAFEIRLIIKNKEEVIFIFEKTVPHIN